MSSLCFIEKIQLQWLTTEYPELEVFMWNINVGPLLRFLTIYVSSYRISKQVLGNVPPRKMTRGQNIPEMTGDRIRLFGLILEKLMI